MKTTYYHIPLELNIVVAVIADLHDEVYPCLIESINHQQPNYIFLVGDVVDRPSLCLIDSTIDFLISCVSIAPTYYSFGNHERALLDSEIETITSLGVIILDNTWGDGGEFLIGGLSTDSRDVLNDEVRSEFRRNTELRRKMSWIRKNRHFNLDKATQLVHGHAKPVLDWLKVFAVQEKPKILLCHHPEYYDKYLKDLDIDLIISGHAHGGQIRLLGRGLYSPGQGYIPKYTSGIYDGKLIVSRGLANTTDCVPRLFNPRELVYLHL